MREQSCGIFDSFGAIYDFRLRLLKELADSSLMKSFLNRLLCIWLVLNFQKVSKQFRQGSIPDNEIDLNQSTLNQECCGWHEVSQVWQVYNTDTD